MKMDKTDKFAEKTKKYIFNSPKKLVHKPIHVAPPNEPSRKSNKNSPIKKLFNFSAQTINLMNENSCKCHTFNILHRNHSLSS